MFIKSRIYLDDEYVDMTCNKFRQYTRLEIPEFRDTLIQHMESVKKSIDERAHNKERLNSQIKSLESENIVSKKSVAQFQKIFLRIEAHCVNLELNYQNQALKEGQHGQFSKLKSNEAKVKHDIDVIETINMELEHKVTKLLKENETLKKHYKESYDSIKTTRAKTIKQTTSLIAQNAEFKAQLQEKGFAIAALKNKLRKLKGNSVNTKFAKSSILGKPILHPLRNQPVVIQPTAFKYERPKSPKPWFASQVDVNNDLPKPVTTHYFPRERESAFAKPHHMNASSSSKYSSKDMVHNHYLEEAKKKTQERGRNSRPSVMPSAGSQSTTNGSKPKPRINKQTSKNWLASKTSCVTTMTEPIAEHSRNSRNFSDSKHDSCVTKFLNEVNSHAKFPSHKTTNRNKPVKQISVAKKPKRQILTGHRWVPTGKIFTSSTTKVDSEPPHGSNTDITNLHECIQTLDSSAGTSINVQEERTLDLSVGTPFNLKKERIKACIKENMISGRPRYALTNSPTIYVSFIEQFWQTASVSTLENGDMEITATIDGKFKVVYEASIRMNLRFYEDSDGISTLPTLEIFEQLALMGVCVQF
ncbi:hypothetical protein Tco_0870815 [Tanacetum coccineum]